MDVRYKVSGIDPGDNGYQIGNCLTLRKSRDVVNTPSMYAKIRSSAMGWMNSLGTIDRYVFFEELYASDVVLDHVVAEPPQQGDTMEGAILVTALLIAFPDARFGFGLQGGKESITPVEHYRSLGGESVDLSNSSEARDFLTRFFNYLRRNSYWVDDDLVHMLLSTNRFVRFCNK